MGNLDLVCTCQIGFLSSRPSNTDQVTEDSSRQLSNLPCWPFWQDLLRSTGAEDLDEESQPMLIVFDVDGGVKIEVIESIYESTPLSVEHTERPDQDDPYSALTNGLNVLLYDVREDFGIGQTIQRIQQYHEVGIYCRESLTHRT